MNDISGQNELQQCDNSNSNVAMDNSHLQQLLKKALKLIPESDEQMRSHAIEFIKLFPGSPHEAISAFKKYGIYVVELEVAYKLYLMSPAHFDSTQSELIDILYRARAMNISDNTTLEIFEDSVSSFLSYKRALSAFKQLVRDYDIQIFLNNITDDLVEKMNSIMQQNANTTNTRWLSFKDACKYAGKGKNWLLERLSNGDIFGYQEVSLNGNNGKWVVDSTSIDNYYLRDQIAFESKLNSIIKKVS
ncbi:hypothetical protein Dacet_0701 [Denitrovibrio acetiphilus DSM 12809]|uniref:Uncharacterized protein n=1 Tax=Denitrovibrio acetiphilus (strain DSM 12809 / NBRC 114555 / N2460) TaxID=522772 RepID=D4H4U3_DENA2|nr:hypothetical protein [Denitrovibrio acetiphilus]ADD67487.1 hypothetical protein Dacet_0701 [Denitrovibrio acetiphilus DSM 12809]